MLPCVSQLIFLKLYKTPRIFRKSPGKNIFVLFWKLNQLRVSLEFLQACRLEPIHLRKWKAEVYCGSTKQNNETNERMFKQCKNPSKSWIKHKHQKDISQDVVLKMISTDSYINLFLRKFLEICFHMDLFKVNVFQRNSAAWQFGPLCKNQVL